MSFPYTEHIPGIENSPYHGLTYEQILESIENQTRIEAELVEDVEIAEEVALAEEIETIEKVFSEEIAFPESDRFSDSDEADELEQVLSLSKRSSTISKLYPSTQVVELAFELNPGAKIYGQYVTAKIRGEEAMVKDIDLLWEESEASLEELEGSLREKGWLLGSLSRESGDQIQIVHFLEIDGRKFKLIVTPGSAPWELVSFTALSLCLNSEGEIEPIFNGCSIASAQADIRAKRLNIVQQRSNVASYITRFTHFKLVRDAILLIDQEWTLNSEVKFKVYPGTEPETCTVCHDSCIEGGHALILECGHIFHLNCLEEWISQVGPTSSQCPTCRAEIIY